MSKHPAMSGRAIIDFLKKNGFEVKRQKGSHVFLRHPDGRATVGPGLFAKISRDTELTKADFAKRGRR